MNDPAVVTRDARVAVRYVCSGARFLASEKTLAHRRHRRRLRVDLRMMGDPESLVVRVKRLTGWEVW